MLDLSFLDNPNAVWSREMTQFMEFFVKNTTEKIFRRMDLMGVKSSTIRSTIQGVVYNNAGGDMRLVRFYYLNLARFVELGVGHSFMSDADLGREGVKARNVNIPELSKGNYAPLTPTMQGRTDAGVNVAQPGRGRAGKNVDRAQYHKARPFLMNTIRQETKRIAERMAVQLAYTTTMYISKGVVYSAETEYADENWRRNLGLLEEMRVKWGAMRVPWLEK